jgi:hypothetical protein
MGILRGMNVCVTILVSQVDSFEDALLFSECSVSNIDLCIDHDVKTKTALYERGEGVCHLASDLRFDAM